MSAQEPGDEMVLEEEDRNKMDIEVGPDRGSFLFQVPFARHDMNIYRRPPGQSENSTNCMLASAALLGMIPRNVFERLSPEGRMRPNSQHIADLINSSVADGKAKYEAQKTVLSADAIQLIVKSLFRGYATLVGLKDDAQHGHVICIAKFMDGSVRAIDPQDLSFSETDFASILEKARRSAYHITVDNLALSRGQPLPIAYIVTFLTKDARTTEEIDNIHVNGVTNRLAAVKLKGGATRRSSLPTRRAGRSSSAKRRRYTHRRRALRTGKGGYRPTRKGRKA